LSLSVVHSFSFKAGCILWALALWSVLTACESAGPKRTLDAVEPSTVSNLARPTLTLRGSGFLDVPQISLGTTRRAALRDGYRVQVGTFQTDARRVDSEVLEFELEPGAVEPGVYDVLLYPPASAALVRREALTVRDDSALASQLELTLETLPDGSGERIEERTLQLGDKLELFALLRDENGLVIRTGEVVSFSQAPRLGLLSETKAASTVFEASLPGDMILRAQAEAGPSAEVQLHVDGSLSNYRLWLEDAPGGEGTSLGASIGRNAGDELTCYAVVRDVEGAFVLDVPASFMFTGVQDVAATTTSKLQLTLDRAGVTDIHATYTALDTRSLRVSVLAGRAERLRIEPDTAQLSAGDAPLQFQAVAEDAFGNPTDQVGSVSFDLVDADFGDFDAASATLTPKHIGTGHLRVQSSDGLAYTSGLIEVIGGPLASLRVTPESLQLSADDPPVQFEVVGVDAFDNVTSMLGTLTWSVVNGPIASLSDQGQLDPTTAGTGMVKVVSSLGPSAMTGTIEVLRGALSTLSIQPQTWNGKVGDAPQQFVVTGADDDGNSISDIGTLSYRIATGPISAVNAQSGLFTPTLPGVGTIEVSSSYGLTATTQNIVVSPVGASLRVSAIRPPSFVWAGENGARVEVDVTSTDPREVVISGMALSFAAWNGDMTSMFKVVPDRANSDRIAAGATQTLVYFLDVSSDLSTLTSLTVSATGEAFPIGFAPFVFAGSVSMSTRYAFTGPTLKLTGPVAPADRVCTGGRVAFSAETSNLLSASYEWRIPGATWASGSSATDRTPSADFAAVGSYPYSVTATYFGYPNTLFGTPVYVGAAAANAVDTYPTGQVVFASPSAGQAVALASFPRSDLLALSSTLPLRQCNGSAVAASGHTAVTVFSDRGLVGSSADVDGQTPGIQLRLLSAGTLDSIQVNAPKQRIEGDSTLYAEYFDSASGTVTAAGDVTFKVGSDTQAPSVMWSLPGSNCSGACLASGDPLLFQFSEPMAISSLSDVKVELFSGTSCSGTATDITGTAERTYETAAQVLYVDPPTRTGAFAVRVTLPSTITDNASSKNSLPAYTRCALYGTLTSPVAPAVPPLTEAALSKFSPDGDGSADTVSWKVSADAATSFLRIRITRAGKTVWARLSPTPSVGDYTFEWDGSNEAGRIVGDGIYGYAIEAINRAGTASAALRGYVELDSAVRFVTLRRPQ
jgi:hypothetical protein